ATSRKCATVELGVLNGVGKVVMESTIETGAERVRGFLKQLRAKALTPHIALVPPIHMKEKKKGSAVAPFQVCRLALAMSSCLVCSEALAIFAREDESLYHLGIDEVAVEGVQLIEPEVEAGRV